MGVAPHGLGSLIIKLRRETEVRWRQKGGRVVDSVGLFAMLSERRTFNCCTEMLPRYSAPLFTLLSISRKLELMSSSCSTNRRQRRMTGWKHRGRKERPGAVGGSVCRLVALTSERADYKDIFAQVCKERTCTLCNNAGNTQKHTHRWDHSSLAELSVY